MHDDLRKDAVEALANYLHHRLFDLVPVNVIEFSRKQADVIIGIADKAVENTEKYGKKNGYL